MNSAITLLVVELGVSSALPLPMTASFATLAVPVWVKNGTPSKSPPVLLVRSPSVNGSLTTVPVGALASTASEAALLVTVPPALLTATVKLPASAATAPVMVSVAVVAPEMLPPSVIARPLKSHW